MKKSVLILFLLMSFLAIGQSKNYSFKFENQSLNGVFNQLETTTSVTIRYAPIWVENQTITAEYQKQSLIDIVSDLIKDTDLNVFSLDDKTLIITKNNSLFDQLAESFFVEDKISPETQEIAHLNLQFNQQNDQSTSKKKSVKIGKQEQKKNRYWFTVKGQIRNSETNEPIGGVSISIPLIDKYYSSDLNGFYEIKLPQGSSEVILAQTGYRQLVQPFVIFNDGEHQILLDQMIQALDEVVVQGTKINQVNTSNTGTENINVEETKTVPLVLGERDVLKIAASLPGISSAGEGASGLNVRGGRPDQNLNLLDGGVIYNPTHFFGIFQALNPIAISDVTIYKGSVPSEYGGRLSSVFDISSKNASLEEVKGEVALGPITLNASIQAPIQKDKSSLLIGVRGAYSDWILKKLENEQLRDNKANFYDFIGKYYLKKDEKSDFSITTYLSKDQFNITRDSIFTYSNTMLSGNLTKQISPKKILKLNSSLSSYRHQIDYNGNAQNAFLQSYQLNQLSARLSIINYSKSNHQIQWGNTNTYYWIQPGMVKPKSSEDLTQHMALNKAHAIEGALYLSDVWDLNKKWQMSTALRWPYYLSLGPDTVYDYDPNLPKTSNTVIDSKTIEKNKIESSYTGPEIRWSARYLINEQSSLKMGVNNAYQYLHALSNSTTAAPYDSWKLSDRHLKPQQVQQATFGYALKSENNTYDLSLDFYYKRFEYLTDFKTGAKLGMNEQIETEIIQGNGRAYGVEFLIRKNEGNLNGWISYSYTRSFIQLDSKFLYERVNQGRFYPSNYDKPHDLSIVSNYKLSRRFSFSANISYQTGRPVTFPTGKYQLDGITYITYSDRNKYRIPNYFRIDLGFNVEGNHKINKPAHGFWNVSIYNILGKHNPYSVFFVNENGKIKAYQSSIFAQAIPSISYTLKF